MKKLELIKRLSALSVVEAALKRLSNGLDPSLCYHSVEHTYDVLNEVVEFSLHDGLTEREIELLVIGAAYHDLGFVDKKSENEELGARWAEEAMLKAGTYRQDEISAVKQAILDTKVVITEQGPRQVSSSKLSDYLLDADVSNLGRDDFFDKAERVRQELGINSKNDFLKGVMVFLSAHKWHSKAAQILRTDGKNRNMKLLESKLSSLADSR